MAIRESLLDALSSIATSDFVRSVTAAGASSKVTVSNLAKTIIENYTGSTLGGSSQSVKAAIDASVKKSGDTMNGDLIVTADGTTEHMVRVQSQTGDIILTANPTSGDHGLWSASLNKWLIKGDTNGNVYVDSLKISPTNISSNITLGSAWTQYMKQAWRIGNLVFFEIEATAGSFNANTKYTVATIASGYRPSSAYFASGYTTDGSYNPKGTVSVVVNTSGEIDIRTQAASSSGAFVFISGLYMI